MHNLQSDSVWRWPLGSNVRWAPKSKLVSSEEEETKALSGYEKKDGPHQGNQLVSVRNVIISVA